MSLENARFETSAPSSVKEYRTGWPILLGAVLGMGAGPSIFLLSSGFFIIPLQNEFGWSRGLLSMTWLTSVLTALTLPFMGVLVDRYGPRAFVFAGAIAFTACYLALAVMPGSVGFYLLVLGLVGLVAGPAIAPLVLVRPIVESFVRQRGMALAIGMSGGALIAVFLLPALQETIERLGWRAGYALLAPIALVLGLLSFLLLKSRARRLGNPTGEDDVIATANDGMTFKEAVRDSRFWLIAVAMLTANLAGGALTSQLQPLLAGKGLPGATAAMIGSLFAISVVGGRLLFGALLDRFSPPVVGCLALSAPICGLLLFLPDGSNTAAFASGAVLVALAQGAEGDLLAYFTSRFFGLKSFGAIFGVLAMVLGVSAAAGAVGAGFMFDRFGSYDLVLLFGSGLSVIAAGALLATGFVRRGAAGRPAQAPA